MANILVVDNSKDILDTIKYVLKTYGHSVITVSNKNQLFKTLEKTKPDLILMEVFLGGDNGRDICKELKTISPVKDIPIILMSTHPKVLETHEECFASAVINKPFHLSDFIQQINSVLKQSV